MSVDLRDVCNITLRTGCVEIEHGTRYARIEVLGPVGGSMRLAVRDENVPRGDFAHRGDEVLVDAVVLRDMATALAAIADMLEDA